MSNEVDTIVLSQQDIDRMSEYGIPPHMHDGLTAYFNDHRPVGDFLTLILQNDFVTAAAHADDMNKHALYAYCRWLFMCSPARIHGVWGSKEAVQRWHKIGREKAERILCTVCEEVAVKREGELCSECLTAQAERDWDERNGH